MRWVHTEHLPSLPSLGVVEHGGHRGDGLGLDRHVHEPEVFLVQARQEVVEAADVAQVDLCVVRVSVVTMSSSLSIMRSHPH